MPCVPSRSGTHMAESCAPWNLSGGNVIGTRRTVLQMPCSPRMVQNGFDLRSSRSSGLPQRDAELADLEEPLDVADVGRGEQRAGRSAGRGQEVEDVVLAGFGAGGERGPRDGRERREGGPQTAVAARSASFAKFGSLPSAINRSVSPGSCPSRPTMTTRRILACGRFLRSRRQSRRNGQNSRRRQTTTIVVKRTRKEESRAKPAPGPM